MVGMRKIAVVLLAVSVLVLTAASAGSRSSSDGRRYVAGRISISVLPGWHLIRRSLTDVVEPIPRLALASFAVTLSAHACECGLPNVRDFPRAGAFLFVWEYPHPPPRMLEHFPRRPPHFRITSETPQRHVCQGPSDEIIFQDAGRAFQAEIYLGPAAGQLIRARLLAMIDSLRVAQRPARA